ncbi:MAG: SAM-dependent methyltransferase [Alphaproteobacteria bacterium]|nr:SAM-dependent methyltransferase [Alphaproteobacteria bacterium]
MSALLPIIREKIENEGPISIADYMALALGHPEHGYYRKHNPLGARGDFITSPEISQIFGEMIGVWVGEVWRQLGGGPVSLVELGPGRGTLMADLLRATKKIPEFHDSITIHMIETSPVLAHEQYLTLRNEHRRVEWLDSVDELPESKTLLIANEFFDALPIRQYVITSEGMCERRIYWDHKSESLQFVLGPPGLQLAKSGKVIAEGTVMEQCPAARNIMRTIATRIKAHQGAALIIDYGYMGDAHRDTLQAVKAHQFHPVLKEPGDADITAHVDFTALMELTREMGVPTYGLENQGTFLTRMGAEIRAEMLMRNADAAQREQIASSLQRIVSPQAMGELFKVMAICSDAKIEVPGFQ